MPAWIITRSPRTKPYEKELCKKSKAAVSKRVLMRVFGNARFRRA